MEQKELEAADLLDDVIDDHERDCACQEPGLDDGDEDEGRCQLEQAVAELGDALRAAHEYKQMSAGPATCAMVWWPVE